MPSFMLSNFASMRDALLSETPMPWKLTSSSRKVLSKLYQKLLNESISCMLSVVLYWPAGQYPEDSFMHRAIDRIDLKMLRLLQDNGRLSNAELAQLVDVSPATCHRRTCSSRSTAR